mmetsp:Transcript_94146/g.302980  ORF Transcript_94146/g.302980 Transcript_94146/m.302980 type:complete len:264 (-) Transcript_94146:151-942(-)
MHSLVTLHLVEQNRQQEPNKEHRRDPRLLLAPLVRLREEVLARQPQASGDAERERDVVAGGALDGIGHRERCDPTEEQGGPQACHHRQALDSRHPGILHAAEDGRTHRCHLKSDRDHQDHASRRPSRERQAHEHAVAHEVDQRREQAGIRQFSSLLAVLQLLVAVAGLLGVPIMALVASAAVAAAVVVVAAVALAMSVAMALALLLLATSAMAVAEGAADKDQHAHAREETDCHRRNRGLLLHDDGHQFGARGGKDHASCEVL